MISTQNGAGVPEIDFTSDSACIPFQQCVSTVKKVVSPQLSPFSPPKNAEQLGRSLLDVETAIKLLTSPLPLSLLRSLMVGCYMRYHAIREILKDSDSNFYIDKIIHVNRDGIRFKHCRDNSYRSIHKIKAPENEIDQRVFNLWASDMKKWNEPLPFMDAQASKLDSIKEALASLPAEETKPPPDSDCKPLEVKHKPCDISRIDLTKLVITVEEMVKLIDYGRELFDRTVTGFYTQIRAPPNPSVSKDKKSNESGIFMDQIIGVSWATKPYIMFQRPLTIVLKFRHFRDERMSQLPYWNKPDGISQEVYNQWLDDMRQWDEEYPCREFISHKAKELATVLSEPPRGPPVDVIKLATIEAERENSTKLLKKLKEWQEEQNAEHAMFQPSPPPWLSFYPPPLRPARFPHWPVRYEALRPRPPQTYGRAACYQPYPNRFHRPMASAMSHPQMQPPMPYAASSPYGFYAYPQHLPSNHQSRFRPKAPKYHPSAKAGAPIPIHNPSSSKAFPSAKKLQPSRDQPNNRLPKVYHPQNDYATFEAAVQMGYSGNVWF
ncbi:hypothetical protein GPALN_005343 [Globodera pallida]|nr:hypothetical protein GPALN_005343 [Globodera pallida]